MKFKIKWLKIITPILCCASSIALTIPFALNTNNVSKIQNNNDNVSNFSSSSLSFKNPSSNKVINKEAGAGTIELNYTYKDDKDGSKFTKEYQNNTNNFKHYADILLKYFGTFKKATEVPMKELSYNEIESFSKIFTLPANFRDLSLEITPGFRNPDETLNEILKQKKITNDMMIRAGFKTVRLKNPLNSDVSDDIYLAAVAPEYFINKTNERDNYIYNPSNVETIKINYYSKNVYPENVPFDKIKELIIEHIGSTYGNTKLSKDLAFGVNDVSPIELKLGKPTYSSDRGTITFDEISLKIKSNLYNSKNQNPTWKKLLNKGQKLIIQCKSFNGFYNGITSFSYLTNPEKYNYVDYSVVETKQALETKFKKWTTKNLGQNANVNFLSEFINNIGNTDYMYQDTTITTKVESSNDKIIIVSFICSVPKTEQIFKIKIKAKNYWQVPSTTPDPENNNNNNNGGGITGGNGTNNQIGGNSGNNSIIGNDSSIPVDSNVGSSIPNEKSGLSTAVIAGIVGASLVSLAFILLITFLVLKNKKWLKNK